MEQLSIHHESYRRLCCQVCKQQGTAWIYVYGTQSTGQYEKYFCDGCHKNFGTSSEVKETIINDDFESNIKIIEASLSDISIFEQTSEDRDEKEYIIHGHGYSLYAYEKSSRFCFYCNKKGYQEPRIVLRSNVTKFLHDYCLDCVLGCGYDSEFKYGLFTLKNHKDL